MKKILRTNIAAVLMSTVVLAPAFAQDQEETSAGAVQQDPCIAQPEDETSGSDESERAQESTSLTEKLDRCDGVLAPPTVGDTELVEPAPDKGATPIIPPESLPDDQPPPGESTE